MISLYYGPWVWDATKLGGCWRGPVGTQQALDIRNLPLQSQRGGSPGMGLFASTADKSTVGSDYDLLGKGNWYDIKATPKMRAALSKHAGTPVKGDDLVGLIWDMMTDGADPDGLDFAKPILPTCDGRIELHFGGQRHAERFKWGSIGTNKIRQVLRKDFQSLFDDVQGGKTRDKQIHRKVLDMMCEKYGVEDWKEFVPVALQKDVPGRLPHETTITDDFNRADSATLGTSSGGWSWTESVGDINIVSNAAKTAAWDENSSRADSDLSSSDHYAQSAITVAASLFPSGGVSCRIATGATPNQYLFISDSSLNEWAIYKKISGSYSKIASFATGYANPAAITHKLEANGSSLTAYTSGVSRTNGTDTSITGNTRCGLWAFSNDHVFDNFEAADISAGGGILYTQLERSTRGLNRGMYTGGV